MGTWSIRRKDGGDIGNTYINSQSGLAHFEENTTENDIVYVISYQDSPNCPVFITEHTVKGATSSTVDVYCLASTSSIGSGEDDFTITYWAEVDGNITNGVMLDSNLGGMEVINSGTTSLTDGKKIRSYHIGSNETPNAITATFQASFVEDEQTYFSNVVTVTQNGTTPPYTPVAYCDVNKNIFYDRGGEAALVVTFCGYYGGDVDTSNVSLEHSGGISLSNLREGRDLLGRITYTYDVDRKRTTGTTIERFTCKYQRDGVTYYSDPIEVKQYGVEVAYFETVPSVVPASGTNNLAVYFNETATYCRKIGGTMGIHGPNEGSGPGYSIYNVDPNDSEYIQEAIFELSNYGSTQQFTVQQERGSNIHLEITTIYEDGEIPSSGCQCNGYDGCVTVRFWGIKSDGTREKARIQYTPTNAVGAICDEDEYKQTVTINSITSPFDLGITITAIYNDQSKSITLTQKGTNS